MGDSADINVINQEIIQSPLNKAKDDRYIFIMNLPEALKDKSNEYIQLNEKSGIKRDAITFSLVKATIPKDTVKSQDIQYQGASAKISSHTRSPYDPVTITFRIDNLYKNYLTMVEWNNLILDEKEGHYDAQKLTTEQNLKGYATNISVIALDEYGTPIVQWIMTHAFPVDISSIDLDYTKTDEILCTVTIAFSQMKIKNFSRSGTALTH